MTRERAKELLPVIQAYADGKTVQYKFDIDKKWNDVSGGATDINVDMDWNWRIKPEPKLRPWKLSEVPVGRLINWKEWESPSIILCADCSGIAISGFNISPRFSFKELLENGMEHSLDGGKTWLPCGVEE
jgi:hypothetical protein